MWLMVLGVSVVGACATPSQMAPALSEPACRNVQMLDAANGSAVGAERDVPVLRWFAPSDPGMREELARWCATVGPSVIAPRPAPELSHAAAAGPFRALSWNAAVGGGDLVAFLKDELELDCVGGAPRPGPRFTHFVLLLQEAYRLSEDVPPLGPGAPVPLQIDPAPRPGPMLDVTQVAARCGLALIYVPSARNGRRADGGRREDKGNAILASVPLSGFIAIEVPLEASRKVEVGASLELPDGSGVRIVSVHLDVSAGLARMLTSGNSWRLDQAAAIIDALRLADSGGADDAQFPAIATLVAGDFNVWSKDNSALKLFRRELPQSPAWLGQPTRGTFSPDHLFFARSPVGAVQLVPDSYQRVEPLYHSDHHALAVQLTTRR